MDFMKIIRGVMFLSNTKKTSSFIFCEDIC